MWSRRRTAGVTAPTTGAYAVNGSPGSAVINSRPMAGPPGPSPQRSPPSFTRPPADNVDRFLLLLLLHFERVVEHPEMYIGHERLSVHGRMPTLLHGPGCNLGNGRGCPLVVHYWADLQSMHGLRCYGNTARTRNVSERSACTGSLPGCCCEMGAYNLT